MAMACPKRLLKAADSCRMLKRDGSLFCVCRYKIARLFAP